MIHNKYKIQISTNSEKVIEAVFLDLAKIFDKYGATLSPINKATRKLLEDNSE